MGVNTHTLQPQTHRDLQSRFGREKTSTNSEEKTYRVLIVESFKEDDKNAQYANLKHDHRRHKLTLRAKGVM